MYDARGTAKCKEFKARSLDRRGGGGTKWRNWARNWATNPKILVSIPDDVLGIFHWHFLSGRTMALGSTQTLTEVSAGNISWC